MMDRVYKLEIFLPPSHFEAVRPVSYTHLDVYKRQPLPALEQAGRSPAARRALAALPEYAPMVERLDRAAGWSREMCIRDSLPGELQLGGSGVRPVRRGDAHSSRHRGRHRRPVL